MEILDEWDNHDIVVNSSLTKGICARVSGPLTKSMARIPPLKPSSVNKRRRHNSPNSDVRQAYPSESPQVIGLLNRKSSNGGGLNNICRSRAVERITCNRSGQKYNLPSAGRNILMKQPVGMRSRMNSMVRPQSEDSLNEFDDGLFENAVERVQKSNSCDVPQIDNTDGHAYQLQNTDARRVQFMNISCHGCVNCMHCKNCFNCRNCRGCVNCTDCVNCNGCKNCMNLKNKNNVIDEYVMGKSFADDPFKNSVFLDK